MSTPSPEVVNALSDLISPDSAKKIASEAGILKKDSVPTQIQKANRLLRRELANSGGSTINAREALDDHCELDDWKRLLARYVVPVLKRKQLLVSA
jgi:hypothetical protein